MSSLSDIRVLEFASETGSYTGKLFADLGADVIHIESPEGDPLRYSGPFYKDKPGRENSLKFLYQNTSKRGIVLDITKQEGKEVFLKLIKTADILIESFPPGYLDELGLSYAYLKKENPGLVHTAITPFGQEGPYCQWKSSDLTIMALGGFLYLAGEDDERPAWAYGEQAYMAGSMYGAVGTIIALYEAERTGEGQFLDVSMQACAATGLENALQYWDLEKTIRRSSSATEAGYGVYPCKDGYIYIVQMGDNVYLWEPLPKWLREEGVKGSEIISQKEWESTRFRREAESKRVFREIFESFTMKHDKKFLFEEGQRRGISIAPIFDSKDVVEDPHLNYRKFFKTLYHEVLGGEVCYPGEPYLMEKIPWQIKPAPAFGQHTREILVEIGYSKEQIETLNERGVIYV